MEDRLVAALLEANVAGKVVVKHVDRVSGADGLPMKTVFETTPRKKESKFEDDNDDYDTSLLFLL